MQRKLLDMERAKEAAMQWHSPAPCLAGVQKSGLPHLPWLRWQSRWSLWTFAGDIRIELVQVSVGAWLSCDRDNDCSAGAGSMPCLPKTCAAKALRSLGTLGTLGAGGIEPIATAAAITEALSKKGSPVTTCPPASQVERKGSSSSFGGPRLLPPVLREACRTASQVALSLGLAELPLPSAEAGGSPKPGGATRTHEETPDGEGTRFEVWLPDRRVLYSKAPAKQRRLEFRLCVCRRQARCRPTFLPSARRRRPRLALTWELGGQLPVPPAPKTPRGPGSAPGGAKAKPGNSRGPGSSRCAPRRSGGGRGG